VVMVRRPEIAWLGCAVLPEACVAGTDPVAVATQRPREAPPPIAEPVSTA